MKMIPVVTMMAVGVAAGCERESDKSNAALPAGRAPAPAPVVTPEEKLPKVVFLGDSITAGMGVNADEAFPARVGQMLRAQGLAVDVVNAGVSGDTTAGGLRRLDWLLRQEPDVVVVGLGANDGLRATDPKASAENLRRIVRRCTEAGASVLLLGMLIPPNYGAEYATQFREIYPRVAKEAGVPLVPFMLEGVGGEARLNQRDGIHPTAEGQERVARNVVPYLRDLLRARDAGAATRPSGEQLGD
jgi:acyl-CoA thioesterase-1